MKVFETKSASSPSGLKSNLNILHGAVNATQTSRKEDSQLLVMKKGTAFIPTWEQNKALTRRTA